MAKNIFSDETQKVNQMNVNTQKKAQINAKSCMPKLMVGNQCKELSNKAFGIGRDKKNQLIINDPLVSKFHAIINFIDGEAYIQDTNSKNGTFVNSKRIEPGKKILLKNNDKIKLGSTVITFLK